MAADEKTRTRPKWPFLTHFDPFFPTYSQITWQISLKFYQNVVPDHILVTDAKKMQKLEKKNGRMLAESWQRLAEPFKRSAKNT